MAKRIDPAIIPESPDTSLEESLWNERIDLVVGIDEAGRGALAGPVTTAAVVLPKDTNIARRLPGVRDSKEMSPKERSYWRDKILKTALDWGVGHSSANEIDTLGIVQATRIAAMRAVQNLRKIPQHLIIDYLLLPDLDIPQTSLVKGDRRSLSVAAASVIAKTERDKIMCDYSQQFPEYKFSKHKGYGTADHITSIFCHGPTNIHRMTFSPMRSVEQKQK